MNDSPDWDAFRVLLAVAERGSFSAGARAIGLSQPTAGRRIAELERALGAPLLVRRSRGVIPTAAGEEVLTGARRMAEGAHAALRRLGGSDATLRRSVRISVTEGLGALWLPHHLAALRAAAPGARIELHVDNLPADLGARQADVAIRLFRPTQPDLVARKVGALEFGLFAAPRYLAARGTPRRLAELAHHDHVGFLHVTAAPPPYMRWLAELVPAERFVVATSSLVAMRELARAGVAIALGTAAIYGADRGLVRLLPRVRPPPMDVWLATHVDVRRDPVVGRVVDALTALLAAATPPVATAARGAPTRTT
jgi:DNA-binding transcriptional LysR family regulator